MPSLKHARVVAVTADQVSSRRAGDRVPEALRALAWVGGSASSDRAFARTAGDEIQALVSSPRGVVTIVETLARLGGWRIGLGIGVVDRPVPDDVRAAAGGAFVAAREAVTAARTTSSFVVVRGDSEVSDAGCHRVQAAFSLLDLAWQRRRVTAWEVVDLADKGLTQRDIAQRLGITSSAVSQRMATAAVEEVRAGKELAAWLLAGTLTS